MRNLKKIMALVVVMAMIFSLASITTFAAGGNLKLVMTVDNASLKTEGSAILNVYIQNADDVNADVTVGTVNFEIAYDSSAFTGEDVTSDSAPLPGHSVTSSAIKVMELTGGAVSGDVPIVSAKLTAKKTVEAKEDFSLAFSKVSIKDKSKPPVAFTVDSTSSVTLSIVPSFSATTADAITLEDQPVGTTQDAILAALAAKKATVKNEAGDKSAELATANWALKTGTYDPMAIATYTFEGDVVADATSPANLPSAGLKVSATVTVVPLTTGKIDETDLPTEIKVPAKNESAEYTTDELAAIVKEAIAKVTVVSGTVTDEYVPTVTVDKKVANVDDTATATLSVSGASANGKFNLASAVTKTVALKVVPNAITDGSITWSMNSVISSNTSIAATINYDPKTDANKKVTVTVSDGTTTVTLPKGEDTWTLPEDQESYQVSIGKLKDLFGTAPAVGTELSFKVAVDGADVAYEVPETGDAVMENTLKVANASSGSGSSGLPTGGSTTVTYKITVAESENGTATAPAKAAKGETVTITTTPAKGYKTDVITVKTEKGTNVPVTDKTFTMPAYNVTVTVTFVEGEEPVEPAEPGQPSSDLFSDVPSTHWAYDFVKEMKELGIVNGVSDTEFAPDANITRAEFAKMVAEAFGLKATSSESAFVDCTASDWYTPYVIAGTEAGILKGVSADSFGANDTITRQDICTVLGRVLDAENTLTAAEDSAFADMDQVADYAVAYVKAFVGAKVVNGYEDGTFRPAAYATRAEVCKILSNVLKLNKTEAENGAEVEAGAETETGAEAEVVTDAAAEAEAEADAEAEIVEETEAEEAE